MLNRFNTYKTRQISTSIRFFSSARAFSNGYKPVFETTQSKFDTERSSLIKDLKETQKKYLDSKTAARDKYEATLPLFKRHLRPLDPSIDLVAQDANCGGVTQLLNKVLKCKTAEDMAELAPQIRDFKAAQPMEESLEVKNSRLR